MQTSDNLDIAESMETPFSQKEMRRNQKQYDPFEQVMVTKNMDNQILTSFRTLQKSNNLISGTLKVIHQRF